jgi:hypothetical protein
MAKLRIPLECHRCEVPQLASICLVFGRKRWPCKFPRPDGSVTEPEVMATSPPAASIVLR